MENKLYKDFLFDIIKKAGNITLKYFKNNFEIKEKGEGQGIVTTADLASENYLKDRIHKQFPSHAILAEESGLESAAKRDEYFIWIIDPIDGTTNFSKGNPYYNISISFGEVKNSHYHAISSAVYQPTTNLLFYAERGHGAFVNEQKIQISQVKELKLASISTGFSSNKGESLQPLFNTMSVMQNSCLGVRVNGAAALDLANTAFGIFDGFYENPLAAWDMAAGAHLILEAGGKVTNFFGSPFCPINDRGIIASNPYIYEDLFKIIKENYRILAS